MDLITPMRTYVKAVETGSFAAAAEALDVSPQLVGKQIQALEQHLGIRLLNRTTRKQSLTEFGEAFLERARAILEEIDDTERLAASARGEPVGRLRINAPVAFGTRTLAPVLPKYMASFPKVAVDLNLSNHLVNVVEDAYDIVFRVGELADSGLVGRRLGPYLLLLCASPGYLASSAVIRHPSDLAKHECLGFAHSNLRTRWTFTDADGQLLTIPVTSRLMVNQSEPLLSAALAGLGLILQPLELVRGALKEGRLVEVLPEYPSPAPPLSVLYARDRRMTPKLQSFLEFCASEFDEDSLTRRD
jgi:DNA-binding transcriptional LysR family regulator